MARGGGDLPETHYSREFERARNRATACLLSWPTQFCSLCTVGLAGTAAASETSLEGKTKAAGVFVVVFSCAAAVVEVLIVVLRFLNIGAINLQMRKFFIVDITVSLLLLVGFVTSGIVECVFAAKLESRDEILWKETSAAAVSCFVSAVLAGVLAVWSVLFLVRRWYYKILQYMSLP
ncbi:hypothetical protein GBAR_LOCUS6245 [Geodia barretti]|uniref:Uncharacterized protein n=1 Tax=Geodia barretti TaxID=519541 RepID=A0AA35W6K9_GEOBA|nr:hypothetical protein GBAR_LOCUS6245 [Geodia barretti]